MISIDPCVMEPANIGYLEQLVQTGLIENKEIDVLVLNDTGCVREVCLTGKSSSAVRFQSKPTAKSSVHLRVFNSENPFLFFRFFWNVP